MRGDISIRCAYGAALSVASTLKSTGGSPLNVTGYTARAIVRKFDDSASYSTVLSLTNSSFTFGGATGVVTLAITALQTTALGSSFGTPIPNRNGRLEIYVTPAVGSEFLLTHGEIVFLQAGEAVDPVSVDVYEDTFSVSVTAFAPAGATGATGATGAPGPNVLADDDNIGGVPILSKPHGLPVIIRDETAVRYQASKVYLSGSAGGGVNSDHLYFAQAKDDATAVGRLGSVAIELESDKVYVHDSVNNPLCDLSDTIGVHLKGTGGDGYCKVRVVTGPKRTVQANYAVANTPVDLTADLSILPQTFTGVGAGIDVIVGDIVQLLHSSGDYILGVCTAYAGTTMTLEVYLTKGTTSRSGWAIIVHDTVIKMNSTNAVACKGFSFYVEDLTWAGKCISLEHSAGLGSDASRPHIEFLGFYGISYATSGVVPMWTGIQTGFLFAGEIEKCAFANGGRAIFGGGGPFEISKITTVNMQSPPVRLLSGQSWEIRNFVFEPTNDGGPNTGSCHGWFITGMLGMTIGSGTWCGDDSGFSPTGRYWGYFGACSGIVILNANLTTATAGRAPLRIDGCNGLFMVGGYVSAPHLIEATSGGSSSYNVHILGVGWTGVYADAFQNKSQILTGSFRSGTATEFYTWGANQNYDFIRATYGIQVGSDGAHQAILGSTYSTYLGSAASRPAYSAGSGGLLATIYNTDWSGWGDGIVAIGPHTGTSSGGALGSYDGSTLVPVIRWSFTEGLTQKVGPRITVPKTLTLANGANDALNLSGGSVFDVVGPTGAFSFKGIAAETVGSRKRLRWTLAQQATFEHNNAGTAANGISTTTAANVVIAAAVATGHRYADLEYSAAARWELRGYG